MTKITKSTGNVFADIGVPNAKEHALKAALVTRIAQTITDLHLTRTAAADRVGVTQPDISKILKGQFRPTSVEHLLRMLTRLGQDVRIEVKAAKRPTGKVSVEA